MASYCRNNLWIALAALCSSSVCLLLAGCSQTEHRLQADHDAYCAIAERNVDPRWAADRVNIDQDPRSRYFDPYNPDCSPMPQDDPASQAYMQCVDRMEGWPYWRENGIRGDLENPAWRNRLGEYSQMTPDGAVQLDVDSALRLAYVHSPLHQQQLETLYLSSLDVTGERFRLDTQFFAGVGKGWTHNGGLLPASIFFNPVLNDYQQVRPVNQPESNRLTVGGDAQLSRRFATAGEVLVGFANSFVFEFTGGDVNLASSLANFSFIQPLLRGAGRDIALEQLTQAERLLLANLRAYGQFRQGLFTQVVIGELGVTGPQRGFTSTSLQSFSGFGGVNGYLGLLQQAQQIRNTEDNLRLQLRTRDRLEALYNNDLIDIVQLDQFRQNIEVTRATLLDQTNALKLSIDNFKVDTLGLPSDLPVEVDEGLVNQFQLIPRASGPVLRSLLDLQQRIGDIGELTDLTAKISRLEQKLVQLPAEDADSAALTLDRLLGLVETVGRRLDDLPDEVDTMRRLQPGYLNSLQGRDREALSLVLSRVEMSHEQLQQQFEAAPALLEGLLENLPNDNLPQTLAAGQQQFGELLALSRGIVLLQWVARDMTGEPEAVVKSAREMIAPVQQLFAAAEKDVAAMEESVALRQQGMTEEQIEAFALDRRKLRQRLDDLARGEISLASSLQDLQQIEGQLNSAPAPQTVRDMTGWIQSYLQVVERLSLVPAQARLETITVGGIELDEQTAFEVALQNRLDFMNGRAALVDSWRAIQVAADALQSNLTITGSGEVGTGRNNPVDFRAATSSLTLGLEFDAPLARLLERNGYREALITYQRNRRALIQSRDSLQRGLRALLRTLQQRRLQLEIQRRAVAIALRRVDQTQLSLLTPPPQGQPGVRPQINPTTAINLLGAQSSLQTSQNSFLAAWLNYYAARVRLYRELGVMQLDDNGKWIQETAPFSQQPPAVDPLPVLPPAVPIDLGAEQTGPAGPADSTRGSHFFASGSLKDGPTRSVVTTASESVAQITPIRPDTLKSLRSPPSSSTMGGQVSGPGAADAAESRRAVRRRRKQRKIEKLRDELRELQRG